jgi:hypothetical protein
MPREVGVASGWRRRVECWDERRPKQKSDLSCSRSGSSRRGDFRSGLAGLWTHHSTRAARGQEHQPQVTPAPKRNWFVDSQIVKLER